MGWEERELAHTGHLYVLYFTHTHAMRVYLQALSLFVNVIMLLMLNMLLSPLLLKFSRANSFSHMALPSLVLHSGCPLLSLLFLIVMFVGYMYIGVCMCVCRYTHLCAHVNRPKRTSNAPLGHSLPYALETGSLTEVELCWQPTNPMILLSPPHRVLQIYRHKDGHTCLSV